MAANPLQNVLNAFGFDGPADHIKPLDGGHINDTMLLTTQKGSLYVLQRINTHVFTDPQGLMENIFGVTEYLRERIVEQGGDPDRETLTFLTTRNGALYYNGAEGAWRAYRFQSGLVALGTPRNFNDFRASGKAFGRFQALLKEYPAESLYVTIPRFHDTPARMEQLHEAIRKDHAGRADSVKEEIAFALEREASSSIVMDLQNQGILPLRVTHNDTKLNNVLLDPKTGEGVCVIDLDTVMPGQAIFDFGDSIRHGATAFLKKGADITLDLGLFEAYTQGFLEGCNNILTPIEKDLLPTGAWMMTLECGIRFLTDYLKGDIYFKTECPEHNLVRARSHFKLVREIEEKQDQMQAIIAKY